MNSKLLEVAKNHLVEPLEIVAGEGNAWRQLAVIDIGKCAESFRFDALPPYPVIGVGNPRHPVSSQLDAVLEPPIQIESIIDHCERFPRASAITVQLLRSLEGLPLERALVMESMCYGLLQGSTEYRTWLDLRKKSSGVSASGKVLVERYDDVLHVTLDRPMARNAMDRSLRDEIFNAFTLAVFDSEIKTIRFRAAGSAFCAGGDLKEFGTIDPAMAHLIRGRTLPAVPISRCAEILDVHVQGACVGAGLEMAAFASRFVATADAWFQLPELGMGLIAGAGGCVSVPRRIGRQRAALLMLSGQRIDAETALGWKLIDAIGELTE